MKVVVDDLYSCTKKQREKTARQTTDSRKLKLLTAVPNKGDRISEELLFDENSRRIKGSIRERRNKRRDARRRC